MTQRVDTGEVRPCYPELIAILVAGVLHVAIEKLFSFTASQYFNAAVVCGFGCYLVWRAVRTEGMLRAWGMRTDNFWPALRAQALFAVPAAVVVYGYGLWVGSAPPPKTFWLIVCLYPLWGIAQQFAVQNLIARNLRGLLVHPWSHALVTALLFSASHVPNLRLAALVLVGGVGFTLIYRRHPNLWAVGIAHGFLGALAYYLVIREDPAAAILKFLGVE